MSVKKSFSSDKYVCIKAQTVWKSMEGKQLGEAKDLEVTLQGIDDEVFIFAQQQCNGYSGLASELMRTSHINTAPFNRLVPWQEMHI